MSDDTAPGRGERQAITPRPPRNEESFKPNFKAALDNAKAYPEAPLPTGVTLPSTAIQLTTERKSVHGDWRQRSAMGCALKELMRKGRNWNTLDPMQKEALDMIQTKVSRILTGDPLHRDHWDDIEGYALLGQGGHENS